MLETIISLFFFLIMPLWAIYLVFTGILKGEAGRFFVGLSMIFIGLVFLGSIMALVAGLTM